MIPKVKPAMRASRLKPSARTHARKQPKNSIDTLQAVDMGLRGAQQLCEVIRTIGEERRRTLEIRAQRDVELARLNADIQREEQETVRLLGQYAVEIRGIEEETKRIVAETERNRFKDAQEHEREMAAMRYRHDRDMRILEIFAKMVDTALAQYKSYTSFQESPVRIEIDIDLLDRMNTSIAELSSRIAQIGTSAAGVLDLNG